MSTRSDLVEQLRSAWRQGHRPEAPYANLQEADLRYAELRGADLRRADLRRADLWGARLCCANLSRANLRDADLRHARWDGLCADGLPSGRFLLIPTPEGWCVNQGCYKSSFDDFVSMTASDDWPESTGDEIMRRRPIQKGVIALAEAHIADHKKLGTIEHLKEKWRDK